ncbi:MAG: thiamine phosphate synthase [Chitinophagales bacterium]
MDKKIASLHYLTQDLPHFSHVEQVKMACESGVEWIQLRVKNSAREEWLQIAKQARSITESYGKILIINDEPLIAKEVHADGVHLGRDDMHWKDARIMLGIDAIIGVSTHSWEELLEVKDAQIDYAGLGPFRFTNTKEKLDAVLGIDGITQITKLLQKYSFSLPVIAIGGITLNDVQELMSKGVKGIAVSSAINATAHPAIAAKAFLEQLKISISKKEAIIT